jgi:hypothetical protein
MASSLLLNDVSAIIESHIDLAIAFFGNAAPNALVVLLQALHILVSGFRYPVARLGFGEAVGAG